MADSSSQALRVDVIGVSDRVRARYQAAFAGPGRGACLVANATVAEAVIVDLDAIESEAVWDAYRERYPRRPAVFLASDPGRLTGREPALGKPVRLGALLAALQSVRLGLETEAFGVGRESARLGDTEPETECLPVGPSPEPQTEFLDQGDDDDATVPLRPAARSRPGRLGVGDKREDGSDTVDVCGDLSDTRYEAMDPDLFVDPATRLLGVLRVAVDGGLADAALLRLGKVRIIVDPAAGTALCNLQPAALQALCPTPLRPHTALWEPLAPEVTARWRQVDGVTEWPSVDALLWQVALWTYQGRLPAGTEPSRRVYLAAWPDLTRLALTPHAARIAAIWVAQPLPLAYTAEALGIPQRYVFAFYGAAHAVGLAGQARREADHLFAAELGRGPGEEGLLGRMMRHLRGAIPQ